MKDRIGDAYHQIKDRTGEVHNHLTIISFDRKEDHKNYWWKCRCVCGTIKSIRYHSLKSNTIKSCGCKRMEVISKANITHGLSKTSEYNIWRGMIKRCIKLNNKNYKDYGAKGITICQRWLESFENFIEDMGMKPSKEHSIDRIENDGNYEPNNCKWSTDLEQANNRSNNIQVIDIITNEEYSSISSAARSINMKVKTLHNKLTGVCKNNTNLKIKKQNL